MARDLLLEIGTEEIPACFMPAALAQLRERAARLLEENRLELEGLHTMGTPRRLVLQVRGLAENQDAIEEKLKGPSRDVAYDENGEPTKAAQGFARKLGLSVEDLQVEDQGNKQYLVAFRKIPGEKTSEVLKKVLPSLVKSLSFPKNMFWEESRTRFARPIRWLLCLFGGDVVPFEYAGLKAGRETRGHRLLSPGKVDVNSAGDYLAVVEKAGVWVDHTSRAEEIEAQVAEAALGCGGREYIEPALLEEVTFLVEQPTAVACTFPEDFLELPREVLVTTMQSHQRYFPVERPDGTLSAHFITVSNNPHAPVENIRNGNERVLKARLADARFFFEEDLKTSLEEKADKLNEIVFQEELGTVYDKTLRVQSLVLFLADKLPELSEEERRAAERAAYLCKADLTAQMVGEFPELQGVMGREYALRSGEEEAVAETIFEHYLPRYAGDDLPHSSIGALVALADRVDHLAGCFAVDIRPTGSQDPYALRRQSLGIMQIMLEHRLPVGFEELAAKALSMMEEKLGPIDREGLVEEVKEFSWQRLRYLFQEKGVDYDIVDAVLSAPLGNVFALWQRARFLQDVREKEELALAAEAYVRIANLAHRAGETRFDPEMLQEKEEKELFEKYLEAEDRVRQALEGENFLRALKVLAELKTFVDRFFDEVLVMVEDEALRNNRLALLRSLQDCYLSLADFSKIVFSGHS